MKKILIGAHNLDRFVEKDRKRLCLGSEHILTPGARDAVRNRGYAIVYSGNDQDPEEPDAVKAPDPAQESAGASARAEKSDPKGQENPGEPADLGQQIICLLKNDFDLRDPRAIRDITLKILKEIEDNYSIKTNQ